jgi:4-hydroxybenzoate polyprenyltransferase
LNKIAKFLKLIDFSHSLFGLPFAYLGAILAAGAIPGFYHLFWITIAMIAARTAALCLNRLIALLHTGIAGKYCARYSRHP